MRIALWQCEQQSGDVAGNLERLRRVAAEVAAAGVDLLVCPEMFLTGYDIEPGVLQRLAEPADGASAQAVAAIARDAGVAIVWGYAERTAESVSEGAAGNATGRADDDDRKSIFNAAQAVDANGQPLANYRKTHLYGELDRARFRASDGAGSVFTLAGWHVGLLICYDLEFPEAVRRLALDGADMVVVPTANMAGFEIVPNVIVLARAYENQLVVAYANCCGSEGSTSYGGLSGIAGIDGRLLAQAGTLPAVVTVDIGAAPVPKADRLPYLADRRPEAYRPSAVVVVTQPACRY